MADNATLEIGSKEQVAYQMADRVVRYIESKDYKDITRKDYLALVAQCVVALRGIEPG